MFITDDSVYLSTRKRLLYAYRMLLFLFQWCKCVQRACVVAEGKGYSDGAEQFFYMGYE